MAINLPVGVVVSGTLRFVVRYPMDFVGPDGIQHPAAAWTCWSHADFSAACPGWAAIPLLDTRPADTPTHRHQQKPQADWAITATAVVVSYEAVEIPLADRRQAAVRAINTERDRRLSLGAPYAGKLIDVSDRGRADLGGMVSAAVLAAAGTIPWAASYADGWITMDNTRLALPTPGDGVELAATVGEWYGRIVQYARSLKDAALASDAPESVLKSMEWPG